MTMAGVETPARKGPIASSRRLDSPDSPDFAILEVGRRANNNHYESASASTPTPVFGRTTQMMSQAKARAAAAAAHQEQEQARASGQPQAQRQGHSNLFVQRKKRPEHHNGTRVYAPKVAAYADRPAAPLQMFSSDIEPPAKSIFFTNTKSGSSALDDYGGEEFYTDPDKASADLKALLEGGMDDDDDDGDEVGDAVDVGADDDDDDEGGGNEDRTGSTAVPDRGQKTLGKEGEAKHRGADKTKDIKTDHEIGGNKSQVVQEQTEAKKMVTGKMEISKDGTLDGLKVRLLPHQVEGVQWMRGRELGPVKRGRVPKGGILADDMGLGKTLQAISLILSNQRPNKGENGYKRSLANVVRSTLVVAPLALIRQWEAEINEKVAKTHKLSVCVHHGPNRTKRFTDLADYDVVITTYQILVSELGQSLKDDGSAKAGCFGLHWWRVVLDEAHTVKNRNAKTTKACYALKSEYRWCLSGTPMQNNLDELQSLIKFLRIRPYDKLGEWKDHIERPMKNGQGHIALRRLHSVLRCFMKRRTKDILREDGALNPGGAPSAPGEVSSTGFKVTERKIVSIEADFTPAERELYRGLEARADKSIELMMKSKVDYANAFTLLLRLRQACNHPELLRKKIDKDMYQDAVNPEGYQKMPKGSTKARAKAKTQAKDGDMDSVADLFADMGLATRSCSVCRRPIPHDSLDMCQDCHKDLGDFEQQESKNRKKPKSKSRPKKVVVEKVTVAASRSSKTRRPRARNVVVDSDDDDDDDEGSWLVPEGERGELHLGKAGGEEDENADGCGDWIGDEDSKHESESEADDEGASGLRSFVVDDEEASQTRSPGASDMDDSLPSLDALPRKTSTKKLSSNTVYKNEASDDDGNCQPCQQYDDDTDYDGESDEGFPELDGRLIMPSAKIRQLLDILEKEIQEHKFIVFSEFTSMMDVIELFFDRAKIRYTRYDGKMRNDEREASLGRLRNDLKCRVLLCSLKCGSLGLNLTAATRVVILEPFWNPFVEEQAIDRVHRLTQTVDVIVYKITIKDTVEARILDLQDRKRMLAEQAIEGSSKGALKLGMVELMKLFRPNDHDGYDYDPTFGDGHQIVRDIHGVGPSRRKAPTVGPGRSKESEIYGRRW
jgi:SNF2 family DNA or RNA helicase